LQTHLTPTPAARRRRRVLGAAAATLGLVAGLQTTTVASALQTAPDTGPDTGPVGTDPGVSGVIEGLLGLGDGIVRDRSTIKAADGKSYWLENHVDTSTLPPSVLDGLDIPSLPGGLGGSDAGGSVPDDGIRREYLVVWAGDNNVLDKSGAELTALPKTVGTDLIGQKDLVGPDFFAIVDATVGSPSYGTVVNTATVGPLVENEPHHMQYIWHKGNNIFAGGLFTDVTYVVDTSKLPRLQLKAVNLPTDTLCGSVPDAYWVTKDGNAYGTYTDGSVRTGNGFGGSPGELVRLGKDGKTISEAPAATVAPENEQRCDNIPALPAPTCANPHGVQAREDLGILVTSDYNEPRNIILNPVASPSSYLRRPTVRTWDISDEDDPKLKAVSFLPDGPRVGKVPHQEEPRAAMETTVTNLPAHKGAFAQTMQGGAIYYAPDITADQPAWREVFDLTTSNKLTDPTSSYYGGGSNGGWLQTSLDDKYLYHAVMGRPASGDDTGSPPYILKLDIQKLLASGESPACNIDTLDEVTAGGAESDCPAVVDTLPAKGGPHWGALDNLELGSDGYYTETTDVKRLAYSNYFVARTGLNGDHRVCVVDVVDDGTLALDPAFRDERTGETCIDFDRDSWPHGDWGPAKPHSMLFVTADDDIR
jgi:hypothetical protein